MLADVEPSVYALYRIGSAEGVKNVSVSLLLDSETIICAYYVLTGAQLIEAFTFYIDGKKVEPQNQAPRIVTTSTCSALPAPAG